MFEPTVLETSLVKLTPMTLDHLREFRLAGNYPEVWQHMPMNRCETDELAMAWMSDAINDMNNGKQLAFVTLDKKTNQVIGSTRFIRQDREHRKLEIGYTFITPKFQRSYVNSHAKFLMLQHAFEQLGIARVEICTHENNQQSRTAIARIGGKFEGILRKHRRSPNGEYRNTAMFSIIDEQWPEVKKRLLNTGNTVEEFFHVP
ncbi:GNAT family N-acetyltransferase [Litorilituus lipolyticus]|uniref:N-acetyltransferase n=1 Tax=Litorilituus lipolyticus TaxID=2491017 RepID=A0A502L242_9GAMM|nr:GNAT family protein [Litorilituus lipolyticus]TPH18020.1 N-acetyltransferase [Litorilituus lipolyticus]